VYNFFRQGWIAARIREQLRETFGVDPVVITTRADSSQPPLIEVALDSFDPSTSTGFFAGSAEVIDPLRAKFSQPGMKYWYPWRTGMTTDTKARFSTEPPAEPPPLSANPFIHDGKPVPGIWLPMVPATIEESNSTLRPATDNWPFLYTREAVVPGLNWRGVLLTLVLSASLWFVFGGKKALASEAGTKPDYDSMFRAFFLGAGFMLVETKAVVEMALLFGGTWMVNTAVFAAILVMSLAGNLFAGKVNPKRLEPYYIGLFITLGIGLIVSPSAFLGLNPTVQVIGACLLVFAPIAFAGVVFATSFKRTAQPDRVFGANVAGALVGGLAENTSVMLGFQLLLCVAVGFYLLSAVFGNRQVPSSAAESKV